MDVDVRSHLNAHWGMCPRHALGFFTVEAAFRPHLIHGSTILYTELMTRAVRILGGGLYGFAPAAIMRRRLQPSGPCHMCSLGYHAASPGNAPAKRLAQGRDLANARAFADANRAGWVPYICGRCAGTGNAALCRLHLIESIAHSHGPELRVHRQTVIDISTHLACISLGQPGHRHRRGSRRAHRRDRLVQRLAGHLADIRCRLKKRRQDHGTGRQAWRLSDLVFAADRRRIHARRRLYQ
ncbi:hypothetical protein [Burkholderia multivorans]|uniref:hypothetical protein n=1 Tax=Burkholderia multivorans TaxID=87883 RepID=UPI001C23DB60|nr:hypothetical protein [Burkholderia multivorans]MBU9432207.1 hypothetical protein [Burkholderia multivorans]